jgi:protein TonB
MATVTHPGTEPLRSGSAMSGGSMLRFVVPMVLGFVCLTGLFWLLHTLILYNGAAPDKLETLPAIRFTHIERDTKIQTKQNKPPEMPQKVAPPPKIQTQQVQVEGPQVGAVNIGPMAVDNGVAQNAGFSLSAADGDYLPIVKVAPLYPQRAAEQGIEGYVELSFTVTETGSVEDPVVIDAMPKGIFDDVAKRAVLRFKYKPRMEDGKPIRVTGVKQLMTFKLDKK